MPALFLCYPVLLAALHFHLLDSFEKNLVFLLDFPVALDSHSLLAPDFLAALGFLVRPRHDVAIGRGSAFVNAA